MTLADTCAPFIAVPIARALLRLKRMLPGTGGRRYRCMVSFPIAGGPEPAPQDFRSPQRAAEAQSQIFDILWLPTPHTRHEHYTH